MDGFLKLSPQERRLACFQVEEQMRLQAASVEKDFWIGLELLDFCGPAIDGGRATKLNPTRLGCRQTGVDALLDDPALEFGHRHQDAQLEPPSRVVVGSVDALAAGDQRHPDPLSALSARR